MSRLLPTLVVCLLPALSLVGQEEFAPRELHPWAKLRPGSWKRVRNVVETIDKSGAVTAVTRTESTTTLNELTNDSYTLCVETTIELGDRTIASPPRYSKLSIHGGPPGQTVAVKKLGDVELTICGNRILAEQRQVTLSGGDSQRVSVVYFSERIPPYVLKRETTVTDPQGKLPAIQTEVDVVAMEMPYPVADLILPTSYVRSVQRQINGPSLVTLEVHCPEIPGGVVYQSTKKLDSQGNMIERRTSELVAFETLVPGEEGSRANRRRIFSRGRRN